MRFARSFPLCCVLVSLAACEEGDSLPPGRISITQGQEKDVWTQAPAVESIEISEVTESDDSLKRSDYLTLDPPSSLEEPLIFDMRGVDPVRYDIRGLDADGEVQVLGMSPWVQPNGLEGFTLLAFVGRVGEFGRAPYDFNDSQPDGTPAAMVGQYLLVAGAGLSAEIRANAYDFGLWKTTLFESFPCFKSPCQIETLAITGEGVALAIAEDWAMKVDLAQSQPSQAQELPRPAGLDSWADLAGGAVLQDPDAEGDTFIVGGTRAEVATSAVLRISPDGQELQVVNLAVPRMSAAAAWVEGQGLVVAAGSELAPGAEVLAPDADAFAPLALPADAVTGAALALVEERVVRLGGRLADAWAETVELDLACEAECAPVAYGPGPLELDRVSFAPVPGEAPLALGSDADGFSRVLRIEPDAFSEIPLRETRTGATMVPTPWGHVAVLGGGSASVELYTPACLGSCEEL